MERGQGSNDSDAQLVQVIRTNLSTRGDGKTTVLRRVEQFWSPAGELLAEVDPFPEHEEELRRLRSALGRIRAHAQAQHDHGLNVQARTVLDLAAEGLG